MRRAGDELRNHTQVLSVSIPEVHLPDRVVLTFIVKNEIYSSELNLFEASHRPAQSYPVVIDPPKSDIPDFLKRERPALAVSISSALEASRSAYGTTVVRNEWICATPSEFTEKIRKLLSLDYVKSNIVSLLAPSTFDEARDEISEGSETNSPGEDQANEAEEEG